MNKKEINFIERELSQFKRKFWLAKLLQGLLIFVGTGLVLVVLIALLEYFTWFSVLQRTVVFWTITLVDSSLIAYYILWPIYQIATKGNALEDTKASVVIGSKIEGINDRLTNYLELRKLGSNNELIYAGILQKQKTLSGYSFSEAVKFSSLKPFLLFLIPVFLMFAFVWSGNRWFMLAEGADRLVNFSVVYERQLPFVLVISDELVVDEGQDFTLTFSTQGDIVPEELIFSGPNNQSTISRQNQNEFSVTLQNCLHDVPFRIGFDDVFSKEYVLHVRKKAVVGRVSFHVKPPAYTNISPYTIENSAQLEVPQFSDLTVLYAFKNTQSLEAHVVSKNSFDTLLIQENEPIHLKANQDLSLYAYAQNKELSAITLKVLVDNRPELEVKVDSTVEGIIVYVSANDDYGITKASAVFIELDKQERVIAVPAQGALLKSKFFVSYREIALLEKLKVSVFDTKGVTTRVIDLTKYKVQEKTESELLENAGSNIDAIVKEEKNKKASFSKKNEERKKRAEQIQKSAKELSEKDSVLYDRFEKLSEEILKLTEELDKKIPESRRKITEKKIEEKIAELEKEWMILQTIEQLKNIEDSLAKSDKAIDKKQMDELQKSADDLEKKMQDDKKADNVEWKKFDDLEKKNNALDSASSKESKQEKAGDKKPGQKPSEIKDQMKEDSESLRQQLSEMSDIMMSESAAKNVELIRRLELRALKNSKNQELVYNQTVANAQIDKKQQVAQKEVNQSAINILDSLSALTVGDPMMAQVLADYQVKLEENVLQMANSNAEDAINYVSNQRYLQYGLNELAAILYDILKAESQSLMDMKEGNKSCNKPKPGKGKKPSLSQQQKELGEKMGKQSPKPGKGSGGKQPMSQAEILELIKGQEQIIEQYEQKGGSKSGDGELQKELNKQLEDLINRDLEKALERNKSIEDKLIVLEQSENQKEDQKEERQSKENQLDYDAIKRDAMQDYLRSNQRGTSVVNLPTLKNYFTGKWVNLNQE